MYSSKVPFRAVRMSLQINRGLQVTGWRGVLGLGWLFGSVGGEEMNDGDVAFVCPDIE